MKRWKGSGSSGWWSGFRLKRYQRPVLQARLTGLGCDRVMRCPHLSCGLTVWPFISDGVIGSDGSKVWVESVSLLPCLSSACSTCPSPCPYVPGGQSLPETSVTMTRPVPVPFKLSHLFCQSGQRGYQAQWLWHSRSRLPAPLEGRRWHKVLGCRGQACGLR